MCIRDSIYDEPLGLDRSGHQVVWVHKASQGFDLYLHHADPNTPTRALGDYHLLHVDTLVRPVLTAAASVPAKSGGAAWVSTR